jgi:hypothetical protein
MQVIRHQLTTGLGANDSSAAAGGGAGGGGDVMAPFGESMVEELLHDSFLRKAFGSFFSMLQVRAKGR